MTVRFLLISLLLGSTLLPLSAAPKEPAKERDKQVVTRSEFVSELEAILNRMETEHEQYAPKSEVSELRTLLKQMLNEMDGIDGRTGETTDKLDRLEQRVEHTRRPGF